MTGRERVLAAVAGKPLDRVPVSVWLHNFAMENSAEALAAETLRLARRFDWDFLKPQCRAQCFAEIHVCGEAVLFDEFADYPVAAFSWAAGADNPSLAEGHRRTGRAVMGGLPAKPVIATLAPADVTARGRQAVAEMRGRFLLLAPDCSINPETPEAVMDAARAAVA